MLWTPICESVQTDGLYVLGRRWNPARGTTLFFFFLFPFKFLVFYIIHFYTWSYSGGWASSVARAAKKPYVKRKRANWSILKAPFCRCAARSTHSKNSTYLIRMCESYTHKKAKDGERGVRVEREKKKKALSGHWIMNDKSRWAAVERSMKAHQSSEIFPYAGNP